MSTPQLLVVGLGNLPMPFTRHSVGHLLIDSLASRLGLHMAANRSFGGYYGRTDVVIGKNSVSLSLFKPKALMNITGPSVAATLRHIVKSPESMIVIHDSLGHRPMTVSPKFGGSANGHNGVRSIISSLGSDMNFHRLRVGIGRGGGNVATYVLERLPSHEHQFWDKGGQGVDLLWKEVERIISRLQT